MGDEITLTRLYSENQGLRGFVKEHTVREEVRRQDLTVRVGAIIRWQGLAGSSTAIRRIRITAFSVSMRPLTRWGFPALIRESGFTAARARMKPPFSRRFTGSRTSSRKWIWDDRYSFMEEYRQYHLLLTVLGRAAERPVCGYGGRDADREDAYADPGGQKTHRAL